MDEKITLVKYMHEGRKRALAEGATEDQLRSTTDAFGFALHDVFCLNGDHTENIAFEVILTADGDPFVDWKLHTYDEWRELLGKLTVKLEMLKIVRGLLS